LGHTIPLLTVAIPTYNGTAHLAETLRSILGQECGPFDLLVCDDSSDDGTVELVRDLAGERARIVINEKRLGLAGNWNQCMALSQTPWVSIFHQDDVMLPGHLAWVLDRIESIEQEACLVGLIAGPVRVIDEDSQPVPELVVSPGGLGAGPSQPVVDHFCVPPLELVDRLCFDNPLRCSAVVTNRAAHAGAGGFDIRYRYVVDWDFWYRVLRTWAISWELRDPTVLVRWHSASETHRFKTGADDLEEISRHLDQMLDQENHGSSLAARRRRLANRSLGRAFLNRSYEALRSGRTELARTCMARAWRLSPCRVITTLAADPRLLVQMAALTMAPRWSERWFTRGR
jgi:glycosyltransferase involved in cell wall biosynthesis